MTVQRVTRITLGVADPAAARACRGTGAVAMAQTLSPEDRVDAARAAALTAGAAALNAREPVVCDGSPGAWADADGRVRVLVMNRFRPTVADAGLAPADPAAP